MYDVQDDIKFTYIRVRDLIDGDVLSGKSGFGAFDWDEAFRLLDFIKELNAYPILAIPMGSLSTGPGQAQRGNMLSSSDTRLRSMPFLTVFMKKCLERYGEAFTNNWRFMDSKSFPPRSKFPEHPLYDTVFVAPYFINNILNRQIEDFLEGFTGLYDSGEIGFFNGGLGLLTTNGLKKPLYHAYHFLSCMGDTVLSQGNNHIITRRGSNIQILLYNLPEHVRNHPIQEIIIESNDRYADFAQDDEIHFNISISSLAEGDYVIKQYKLDRESGSIFDKFIQHDAVKYLTERDTSVLNSSCYPRLKVSLLSDARSWSVKSSIPPNCVEFITLNLRKLD